ncbi:retrovirus-related Pol polyprotein from transposon 412 [Trichonephila clavipes]|nr:retrovirus-related Pol polyprotein from transposon 412 [Trichonephila clavipes]
MQKCLEETRQEMPKVQVEMQKGLKETKQAMQKGQQGMQKGLENVQKCQEDFKNSLEKKTDNVEEKNNSVEEKIALKVEEKNVVVEEKIVVVEEKIEKKKRMEDLEKKLLVGVNENKSMSVPVSEFPEPLLASPMPAAALTGPVKLSTYDRKTNWEYFVDGLKERGKQKAVRMADVQDLKSALFYFLKVEAANEASCRDSHSVRGARPSRQDITPFYRTTKRYWALWGSLHLRNDVLYQKLESDDGKTFRWQLILSKTRVSTVLKELHGSPTGGHFGVVKTLQKVQERFYWINVRTDVKKCCHICDPCSARKVPRKRTRGRLQLYNVGAPFERIAFDILGPLPRSSDGNSNIVVVKNYFTQ